MKEDKKNKPKFNQKEYIVKWQKEHKTKFAVDLNKEEYNDLCILLKSKNLTKVQFVRDAFEDLKKK